MKTSAYVKELQAQSVEQLQAQLVDAKKELFNFCLLYTSPSPRDCS